MITIPPWRRGFRNAGLLALLALAALLLVNNGEVSGLILVMASLPAALLASLLAHFPQIVFTAWAWLVLLPPQHRPTLRRMLLLRWYREGGDALLPAGAVMGQAAITRLMIRDGMPADLAASTATLGISLEALSQAMFTLLGLAVFMAWHGGEQALSFAVGATAAIGMAAVMVALQRPPALNLVRRLLRRSGREARWLDQFQASLVRVHMRRGALAAALALHLGCWVMGAIEMTLVLGLIGHPVSFADALVIEAFAQVLRNAGFLLPGSAGVQEGAIVAGGLLVGVPASAALNAALVRRTREVLVGGAGLLAWRRDEMRGQVKAS